MDDILVRLEVDLVKRCNDLFKRALLRRAASRVTELSWDLLIKVLTMLPPGPDHLGSAKLACKDWAAASRWVASSTEWQVSCARASLLPRSMLTERVLCQWLHQYRDEALRNFSIRQLNICGTVRPHHPLLDAKGNMPPSYELLQQARVLDDEFDDEYRLDLLRFEVKTPRSLYPQSYGLQHDQEMQASVRALLEELCHPSAEGRPERAELVSCKPPWRPPGRCKHDNRIYEHIKVFVFGKWIGSVPYDIIRLVHTGEARLVKVTGTDPSTATMQILAVARPDPVPGPHGKRDILMRWRE